MGIFTPRYVRLPCIAFFVLTSPVRSLFTPEKSVAIATESGTMSPYCHIYEANTRQLVETLRFHHAFSREEVPW